MASSFCVGNCSNVEFILDLNTDTWTTWNNAIAYFEYQPWFFSLLGSIMVGLSGILPLLVISVEEGSNIDDGGNSGTLKILLSFAVGGLLGDVFLHLLPEAWANKSLRKNDIQPPIFCGLWVLTGFLIFIIMEKIFNSKSISENQEDINEKSIKQSLKLNNNNMLKILENNNCFSLKNSDKEYQLPQICPEGQEYINDTKSSFRKNGLDCVEHNELLVHIPRNDNVRFDPLTVNSLKKTNIYLKNGYYVNGFSNGVFTANGVTKNAKVLTDFDFKLTVQRKERSKHIAGYLNLLANCIDNFTHGLAVGASFLISFRLGTLTTFAILIHEVPHEIGDFAILLKSGFNRWDAARAQLLTATGGIAGALVSVLFSENGIESRTSWILPFTAGGFLHIGMVSILPELLMEPSPKESFKQLGALLIGISLMAIVTIACD